MFSIIFINLEVSQWSFCKDKRSRIIVMREKPFPQMLSTQLKMSQKLQMVTNGDKWYYGGTPVSRENCPQNNKTVEFSKKATTLKWYHLKILGGESNEKEILNKKFWKIWVYLERLPSSLGINFQKIVTIITRNFWKFKQSFSSNGRCPMWWHTKLLWWIWVSILHYFSPVLRTEKSESN